MEILKKVLRLLCLTVIILLASFGAAGVITPNFRDRYIHKETRIELVEKKEDESDAEKSDRD
jgi:hypothetical protein